MAGPWGGAERGPRAQALHVPVARVPAGAVAAAGPARGRAGEELAAHRAPGSTQACIQLLQSPCLSEGISGAVAGPLPAALFTLADAVYGWCRWQTLQLPVHTRATGDSLTPWCQVLCVPSFPGAGTVVLPQGVCGVKIAQSRGELGHEMAGHSHHLSSPWGAKRGHWDVPRMVVGLRLSELLPATSPS